MTHDFFILIQHDGYDSRFELAVCSDRGTLENWKTLLDQQDKHSPAKRSGEYFEVEQIPMLFAGEKPSIVGIRELLGLSGKE